MCILVVPWSTFDSSVVCVCVEVDMPRDTKMIDYMYTWYRFFTRSQFKYQEKCYILRTTALRFWAECVFHRSKERHWICKWDQSHVHSSLHLPPEYRSIFSSILKWWYQTSPYLLENQLHKGDEDTARYWTWSLFVQTIWRLFSFVWKKFRSFCFFHLNGINLLCIGWLYCCRRRF